MKLSEAMIYYDFNGAEIARVLGIKRQNIPAWKLTDSIPLHHQKTLEHLTGGALKADSPEELERHKSLTRKGLRITRSFEHKRVVNND